MNMKTEQVVNFEYSKSADFKKFLVLAPVLSFL